MTYTVNKHFKDVHHLVHDLSSVVLLHQHRRHTKASAQAPGGWQKIYFHDSLTRLLNLSSTSFVNIVII